MHATIADSTVQASSEASQSNQEVETRTAEWHPDRHTRKIALTRVTPTATILQHVRTVTLTNLGPAPTCEIDTEATPADLPDDVARELGVKR
ncbi:hypothetical protein ACFQL0_22585 [Haloplanus litoreus]|uniref:Uncharacterized protein n=1 Tax=Haloplanus litoreus TaxID=767515 RepID=A0ABD6A523_9EURY